MRHRKSGTKLNMSSSHRQAMFRNMVTSLLKYERIKTTDTRAKELRGWADHIITLAKRGDLHSRRQALAIVREKNVVHKLFEEAKQRFGKVNGGYTRITKLGRRPGDAALVSVIELVAGEGKPKKEKAKSAQKQAAPVKTAASETVETEDKDDTAKEESIVEADSAEAVQEVEKVEAQSEETKDVAADTQNDPEETDEKKTD
jgi:large subunit ribosomal protein L17